jgi:hypothetical protein
MEILIQLIGVLGILASCAAFQCKKHRHILNLRTLSEFIFSVQYLLLGAYTGMAADLIGCLRNQIFTRQIAAGKKTNGSIAIFSLAFTVFGILTWEGPKSILVIIAKVLSTVAYGNKNPTVVRTIILITSSCWLVYNIYVFSLAGIACEAVTLISLIAGILRMDLLPKLKKKKHGTQ